MSSNLLSENKENLKYSKYSSLSEHKDFKLNDENILPDINTTRDDFSNIKIKIQNHNNLTKHMSKIGYIKIGFLKLSQINPIARYNFYIERYNEDFNIYNNIKLMNIPLSKFLSSILDLYTAYVRILLGIFLICISANTKGNYTYNSTYQHYSMHNGNISNSWSDDYEFKNWIFILISSIGIIINLLILYICFWIIYIPIIIVFLSLIYSFYFVKKNKSLIKNNFYRNMIFDENIDKTPKLNDYLTVSPGASDDYSNCSFYSNLLFLYKKRDIKVPQQFMIYGNNYKNEHNIIQTSLLIHGCVVSIIGLYNLLLFLYK